MPTDPLDLTTEALGKLSISVRALSSEVERAEVLRTRKIKALQQVLYILVPAVLLLLVLAFTNFALLNKVATVASDSRSTNTLLLGCFQPGSKCAESAKQQQAQRALETEQQTYVMLICLRLNPAAEDPNATGAQKCVQQYYPGFKLPAKQTPK